MTGLPGWIKSLPATVTIAPDDLSTRLLARLSVLTAERPAPGTRVGDEHWRIRVPHSDLSARVFSGGVEAEDVVELDYRPALESLLNKHSRSGVAVWGVGAQKHGIFLSHYSDLLRSWVRTELIFSPTILLALDADIVLISDEQLHFSVVGASPALIGELDVALGGREEIGTALDRFIAQFGVGFGEDDRVWAEKYLKGVAR